MTDMIEVVARAMFMLGYDDPAAVELLSRPGYRAALEDAFRDEEKRWRPLAKAALTALRDNVSEGMVEAGRAEIDGGWAENVFTAMLDHALTERE